jgi:hypothetical protein
VEFGGHLLQLLRRVLMHVALVEIQAKRHSSKEARERDDFYFRFENLDRP